MIEIYNKFITDDESNELINFYNNNISNEQLIIDNVYNYKSIKILDYNNLLLSNRLKLINPNVVRVQLVDDTITSTEYMHTHAISWTYLIFLNEDFDGGELVIENATFKPVKNQLLIFAGNLKHKVNQVKKGKRYTFICFTNNKIQIKNLI